VEIRFAFPGGGAYDYRGPYCVRALADVILFATGRLADRQGLKIQELLTKTIVLTQNVGLVGSSHGGNACGLVMATHGEEFPDLAFYASMESPYGEGNMNIELGGWDQGVNPAYHRRLVCTTCRSSPGQATWRLDRCRRRTYYWQWGCPGRVWSVPFVSVSGARILNKTCELLPIS